MTTTPAAGVVPLLLFVLTGAGRRVFAELGSRVLVLDLLEAAAAG